MAKHAIDLVRRAEIGASRRARTRALLLASARALFGREGGRATRVEDVCETASIARGTFYNYFPSFDALQSALFEDLSDRFDDAVASRLRTARRGGRADLRRDPLLSVAHDRGS